MARHEILLSLHFQEAEMGEQQFRTTSSDSGHVPEMLVTLARGDATMRIPVPIEIIPSLAGFPEITDDAGAVTGFSPVPAVGVLRAKLIIDTDPTIDPSTL